MIRRATLGKDRRPRPAAPATAERGDGGRTRQVDRLNWETFPSAILRPRLTVKAKNCGNFAASGAPHSFLSPVRPATVIANRCGRPHGNEQANLSETAGRSCFQVRFRRVCPPGVYVVRDRDPLGRDRGVGDRGLRRADPDAMDSQPRRGRIAARHPGVAGRGPGRDRNPAHVRGHRRARQTAIWAGRP